MEIGDRVLVKKLAFEGRHKLADKWEEDVYIVKDQPDSELPVYVVKPEKGSGKSRTLHRNHLLPIGSLPVPDVPQQITTQPSKNNIEPDTTAAQEDAETADDSDEDLELIIMNNPDQFDEDLPSSNEEGEEEQDAVSVGSQEIPLQDDTPPAQAAPDLELIEADQHSDQEEHDDTPQPESPQPAAEPPQPAAESPQPVAKSPPPRTRATRERRPPEFWKYGDFISHPMQHVEGETPDWMRKAQFLTALGGPSYVNMPGSIQEAILKVVMDS